MTGATQQYLDLHLRAQLRKAGCPVCIESAHSEDSYFAWFLIETYAVPEVLKEFTNALGFCREHGARLSRYSNCAPQISFLHSYAAYHLLKLMREDFKKNAKTLPLLAAPVQCPACKTDSEGNQRTVHFLQRLLISSPDFKIYNNPGILCFPHLQVMARDVPSPILKRLLPIHRQAMESLGETLAEFSSSESHRFPHELLRSALEPALRHAIGHRPALTLLPAPDRNVADNTLRDPIAEFVTNMHDYAGCAVCMEVNRAWREWTRWLENAVLTPQELYDILPTCQEHVWACVERGGPELGLAAARNALKMALHRVRLACDVFVEKAPRKAENRIERAWRHWHEVRKQPTRAREILSIPVSCPVCERLAAARDRTISLLFALLEQQRHQAAYEAGYGLCLKHFSRAIALAPLPKVQTILLEVEHAKLASLYWELEELSRKINWSARPEAGGTEQSACIKAIRRFSGLPG